VNAFLSPVIDIFYLGQQAIKKFNVYESILMPVMNELAIPDHFML